MTVELSLEGAVTIVTGAGAGIGREIAVWMARAGSAVVVNDLDPDRARSTVELINDLGGNSLAEAGDVRRSEDIERLLAKAVNGFGRIDFAINNVGMTAGRLAAPFLETTPDDVAAIIEQNLIATYLCCQAEAQALVDQGEGGVILNVSSGETTRPAIGLASYGAAKAGINHLTMTLAAEIGPYGIRVNAIAPGTTLTEEVLKHLGKDQVAAISASVPLRRQCEIDELGRLSVFLCSELARCITGQTILADAGAHLTRRPME